MIGRWIIGFVIGTAVIGISSPWFVRSYVPRVMDPSRRVSVFQSGANYRWRSEGYATTSIGKWGMPGQTLDPATKRDTAIVALWGDSQAEGVCVPDDQKIPAVVFQESEEGLVVLPFARSGDDCNDWISQIESLGGESSAADSDPTIMIDAHVFLITEWSDWCIDVNDPREREDSIVNQASSILPAFVIQAIRNVVTSGEGNEPRELRFRPGPINTDNSGSSQADPGSGSASNNAIEENTAKLSKQLSRLRILSRVPCLFLYAPLIPSIVDGEIISNDSDNELFMKFNRLCREHGFGVVDLRKVLTDSANRQQWPRGFHNGQFGVGHYNAVGNRMIGKAIARSRIVLDLYRDQAKD